MFYDVDFGIFKNFRLDIVGSEFVLVALPFQPTEAKVFQLRLNVKIEHCNVRQQPFLEHYTIDKLKMRLESLYEVDLV